ncbi:MAG TPA: hypothetical protein DCF44_11870, partial [Chitinophagaceae bacterium]|nr:hypothetical protein [Chitinophagaceae bacterium]
HHSPVNSSTTTFLTKEVGTGPTSFNGFEATGSVTTGAVQTGLVPEVFELFFLQAVNPTKSARASEMERIFFIFVIFFDFTW